MWLQGVLDFLKSIWPSLEGALKLAVAGWAVAKSPLETQLSVQSLDVSMEALCR